VTISIVSRRIFVTGNAGAGKTTFATNLAEVLNLPFHGLDEVVWQERWRKTPELEKNTLIDKLISGEAWVIDGFSDRAMQAADVVVFLDVPRRVSALRVIRRNLPYLFRSRPGLPAHCPEVLVIPKLARLIWRFPRHVRPKILGEKFRRNDGSFVHLVWPESGRRFLEGPNL
jgi:adenylate kinase family enzyme